MVSGVHFTKESETFEDPKIYRILVRKLNYLIVTRLNIAHSISVVSQYVSALERSTIGQLLNRFYVT